MKKVLTIFLLVLLLLSVNFNLVYATEEDSDGTQDAKYGIDFSNAKMKTESVTKNMYNLVFSDVKFDEELSNNGALYYMITDTNSEPTYDSNKVKEVNKSENNSSATIYEFEQWFELKQDIYLWIFEVPYTGNQTPKLVYHSKIEKPELKQYTDLYNLTMTNYNGNQILFTMPWHKNTKRSINIKIGEIKDDSLLLSIKNKESNAFAKLLDYGKKGTNSVLTQTVTSTDGDQGYKTDTAFDIYSKINDKSYYYLYTYIDDENGKYIPLEGITLAQASKHTNDEKAWFMFFYGDDNFNWKDFNTQPSSATNQTTNQAPADNTIANTRIPNAGVNKIVVSIITILTITSVAIFSELKKYKDID